MKTFTSTDRAVVGTHTWLTPLHLITSLGDFDLDPCAHPGHQTAKRLICLPDDGLTSEWSGRVWLNPPYGEHARVWLNRLREHGNGIALIFARLETKWLQPVIRDSGVFVMRGRVNFLKPDGSPGPGSAGTGSVLIPFGRKNIGSILSSEIEGEWFQ